MGQTKKENSHRSHHNSGYSQVYVRILWAFFRHVFKNSTRHMYTLRILQQYSKLSLKKFKIRLIVWYIIHINIALKTGQGLTVSCVDTEKRR